LSKKCAWQTAFTTKKDYGKEEREAQWALAQRTLHGLQPPDTSGIFNEKNSYRELSEIAEQAKRRAEVARLATSPFTEYFCMHTHEALLMLVSFWFLFAYNYMKFFFIISPMFYRLRELHTLKGHVESVVKLKGLDIDTIQQHYTV